METFYNHLPRKYIMLKCLYWKSILEYAIMNIPIIIL